MNKKHYILSGRLIDGTGEKVKRKIFLCIQNGLIKEIGDAKNISANDTATVEDLSHCIILPPLLDCSASLTKSPSILDTSEGKNCKQTLLGHHIKDFYNHGVLGVIENDNIDSLLIGHDKTTLPNLPVEIKTPSPDNFVKINYSGNIDCRKKPPTLSHKQLIEKQQSTRSCKTIVIANGEQQVNEALEAGCDCIEQGYLMTQDQLKFIADKDILWIPSLLRAKNALDGSATGGDVCCRFSLRYVSPGTPIPGAEEYWKRMLDKHLALLSLAQKIGVKTAIGTGAGNTGILHGESVIEEIKLFMKAGYSLESAIQAASETGAQFFNINNIGTLTVGSPANFIVTRGSVKQLPRKLSYLENIYINGVASKSYRKNPTKVV